MNIVYTPLPRGGTLLSPALDLLIIIPYGLGAVLLSVYTLGELHLLYFYLTRHWRQTGTAPAPMGDDELPLVTVQVAMYNELYVAERVIDACARLDYPADRLEIQVLDDSTDESRDIAQRRVAHWRERGTDIRHIHRTHRQGYKAGALAEGTRVARGEFIAIFDADFDPPSDFLRRALPHFRDAGVGIVQTRWGHLNRTYSMFTRVQSVMLDIFYVIEQKGRAMMGAFLRFNGSGGMLRKACIEEAGGWSSDTLTEDLDLCYRAQLKGWKAVYDETIVTPGELPVTVSDFKTQQYRWTKGKAQVIRKLMPALWRARLQPLVKGHALFDLFNIFGHTSLLVLSAFSVPMILVLARRSDAALALTWLSLGVITTLVAPTFVFIVIRMYDRGWSSVREFARVFFPFVGVNMAMPLFEAAAMLDGFFGRDTEFHKTSKFAITAAGDGWKRKLYAPQRIPATAWGEGLLALLFAYAIALSVMHGTPGWLPFHFLLASGYTYMAARSVLRA